MTRRKGTCIYKWLDLTIAVQYIIPSTKKVSHTLCASHDWMNSTHEENLVNDIVKTPNGK